MEDKIALKLNEVISIANTLPCVTMIHKLIDGSVLWMCDKGLKELGITLDELIKLPPEVYQSRYFNKEDAEDYTPKILSLFENNNDEESVSFFQQVRINKQKNLTWHMTSAKIFLRDDNNSPILLITQSIPIDTMHRLTNKATKLLEENNFLKEKLELYLSLTKREIEILKHLAKGESAIECGNHLFISSKTVETHRKNIRKKLGTKSFFELTKYARAFDLI
ncbi:helix-turn-helix transcriptional regulator [Pedobacter alpinus]|uniref:Helix-turn-helix transcriptional regulator n=1 Tax=Pedobacter alpinus TaxID=1590643 RepID=A0ABW5TSQ5_9SPHI